MELRRGAIIARGSGIATLMPTADFETYSEAGYIWNPATNKWQKPKGAPSNKKGLAIVGRRNYIKHPEFEPLSLAYNLFDGKGEREWIPPADLRRIALCEVQPPPEHGGTDPYGPWGDHRHPWELLHWIEKGGEIEAWNAGFEFDVWNEYCVPVWGWPPLRLEQIYCAMAKSRAFAYPGALDHAGDVMKLATRKDKDGKRLLDKFSIPRHPTKKDTRKRILPADDPVDFGNLVGYNKTDIRAEAEASMRCPDLSPTEREIWLTDQRINLRGIQVDTVALEHCLAIVEQAYEKYNAELSQITHGAVTEASELPSLKKWLGTRGINASSITEETLEEMLTWPSVLADDAAKRALEIRQELGSASIKKLFSFKNQSYLGRVYDLYMYFGARTGRWTASGPQPQNLPKGFLDSFESQAAALAAIATRSLEYVEYMYPGRTALEVVAACLRGLLIAAPGHELICSDYSAIEGVVTAALAGEEWRLVVFRTHGMIYEAGASSITGISFDEFVRHKRETGKHHPMRNLMGKYSELACGFGGWVGAMIRFGADEFLTEEQMKEIILKWRAASPNIVEFWGGQSRGRFRNAKQQYFGLEGAGISAVLNPGVAYGYRGVVYQMDAAADILFCRVPSGGFLTYHRPRLEPSRREWTAAWELELSYEGWNNNTLMGPIGWIRMDWYGGKACENVVQKEARAIQAHALVNLEKARYRPVIHSHDEIAGEVPIGWGSIAEFERIAGVLPAFAAGWPIKMKGGWRGPRYGKFE